MSTTTYLNNQFLIAMPSLADPNFARSVTLICEHNAEGALGIVINRPAELDLGEVLDQLGLDIADPQLRQNTIYSGGPVQPDRGFVLHDGDSDWNSSLPVSKQIRITTSRDILEALAQGRGPENYLLALGYAGWSGGQLEQEMAANAWLSVPADPGIVFGTAWQERYKAAAALLGIDLDALGPGAGHA
jgi:putative transcriptional regulator